MLKAGICVVVDRKYCRSPCWNNDSFMNSKETFKRPVKSTPPASNGKAVAILKYLLNRCLLFGTANIFLDRMPGSAISSWSGWNRCVKLVREKRIQLQDIVGDGDGDVMKWNDVSIPLPRVLGGFVV